MLIPSEASDSIPTLIVKINFGVPTNVSTRRYSPHAVCETKKLELSKNRGLVRVYE